MSNIVSDISQKIGGVKELAQLCGVSYQAVHLWISLGYVPPSRMEIILDTFPEITIEQLFTAYRNREKKAS